MNYFAHGCRFLDDPYMLAGTAVPDWLNVADRRVRVRWVRAAPWIHCADPRLAAVARGIVQHHQDDAWFHQTDAFNELSWQLTCACRAALPQDEGFRPSFLGHILVELLLDDSLAVAEPGRLKQYYLAMQVVDPLVVQTAVNEISGVSTDRLAWFIERFCQEQFLHDYADDVKLLFRLNQVMRRVRLSALPDSFHSVLELARASVEERFDDLLPDVFLTKPRTAG